ncbi:MAG: AbrB/MazE/SpoVT family DNA-binding domain-containing protein [Candidatus Aenigmarchaeota archaeon]|nr:AbrB/MazE/SpoVT family DNA-binding domain-containing protein [Candidatus Aenigmarchaeota archaeon]
METVKVSPKFQVVIPKNVRESMGIKAGEKLVVIEKGRSIHLIPITDIRKARGMAKGVDTKNLRDESERFG